MRRVVSFLLVMCIIGSLLAGCDIWSDARVFIEPHQDNNPQLQPTAVRVSSYVELIEALSEAVRKASEKCLLTVINITQNNVKTMMDSAIAYTLKDNPYSAYAVDEIKYEIGMSGGETAVAVDISYLRNKTELLKVKRTENLSDAKITVAQALNTCETGVVLYIKNYEEMDFAQYVADYSYENPNLVMELPQVVSTVYPQIGDDRIVELLFTYQTSRDELRTMQDAVKPVFTSAELYVSSGNDEKEKFDQLYSFLMERYAYKVETSITPAYSLLCHGVGDCRAFANIYAAMCRKAGLECTVISGTRDAEAWFWNMVKIGEEYYYVDLLRCSQLGGFILRKDAEMNGYVWDYSAHPAAV